MHSSGVPPLGGNAQREHAQPALGFTGNEEIIRILRTAAPLAARTRVNANYAAAQQNNEAVPKWRYDVTEWLIEVGNAYRFQFETVNVTVSLFDRVLSNAYVPAELLQGSALACMFLASKLHERQPLALKDISSLAGMANPQRTINELEMKILCLLGYDVNTFTVATCLAAVASCFTGQQQGGMRELAGQLAQLALKSYDFLQFSPFDITLALVSAMLAERSEHACLFPLVQHLYAAAGLPFVPPPALQRAAAAMLQLHRSGAPPKDPFYAGVPVEGGLGARPAHPQRQSSSSGMDKGSSASSSRASVGSMEGEGEEEVPVAP